MLNAANVSNKPLAYESSIVAKLAEEGWQGDVKCLRWLAERGEELRQRWENECSYAWAGNSPAYRSRTALLEKGILIEAERMGLSLYLQGDCRGAPIYVRAAPLPISDSDYPSVAQCLYFEREESTS